VIPQTNLESIIVGMTEKPKWVKEKERRDELEVLVKEHLSFGSDYMDDGAVQYLLTGSNWLVRPERLGFFPLDPSGERRIGSVTNWIENDQRQFSALINLGDLLAAVKVSKRLTVELALFEYLVETTKVGLNSTPNK